MHIKARLEKTKSAKEVSMQEKKNVEKRYVWKRESFK